MDKTKLIETLNVCRYRLDFVANIYGSKWVEEKRFLEPCLEALEDEMMYTETSVESCTPPIGTDVLVQYSGLTNNIREHYLCTAVGRYTKDGWEIDTPFDWMWFEVYKWRVLPDWSDEPNEQ